MSIQEVDQTEFNAHDFVERLAWKAVGGAAVDSEEKTKFNPMKLHSIFRKMIKDLNDKNKVVSREIESLEQDYKEEEKQHHNRILALQKANELSFDMLAKLDDKISFVATKVVHVGDQLESINTPRTRVVEAKNTMTHFRDFLIGLQSNFQITSDSLDWISKAQIIQKLSSVASELPNEKKFRDAKTRIDDKYEEMEKFLLARFRNNQVNGKIKEMSQVAEVLYNFKIPMGIGIYDQIPRLCERTKEQAIDVIFPNSDTVMTKFLAKLYEHKLHSYIHERLEYSKKEGTMAYLEELKVFYTNTIALNAKLSIYNPTNDPNLLVRLTNKIFSLSLRDYAEREIENLKEKCIHINRKFYEEKRHQKKVITSGGLSEFRRDIQEMIGTKANLDFGLKLENYGGETFLDDTVSASLIQETKSAITRCQTLTGSTYQVALHVSKLFNVLLEQLCVEHIAYAVDLGVQTVPLSEQKVQPQVYFFMIVSQTNAMFTLFEKFFTETVGPVVRNDLKAYEECDRRRKEIKSIIEKKLEGGIRKSLNAICGWIKNLLLEQKKTDFRADLGASVISTSICQKVITYLEKEISDINRCLDGENLYATLQELGIKFHSTVYDHILKFQYDNTGSMVLLCDVRSYSETSKKFNSSIVNQLFLTLYHLCNLLFCPVFHFKDMIEDNLELDYLDRNTIMSFIQLRMDYKSIKDDVNIQISSIRSS
ncbi:DgyrCDS12151 [Dimorphilus gyrociliatus]|uniref:Exocyst complex component 5 n=1 Tax=Dimorphilus gyrociliatus TaxID=2664684 RepID=A0A7I8W6N4_9ANNE|nr:DgyrCDS12151 [Dimorphilus gyrociliatus]